MKKTEQQEDDFGFSLVDEAELRKYEEELRERLAKEQTISFKQQEELKKKLGQEKTSAIEKMEGLKDMFMPLLRNLARDPDKHYIFWPNRVEKINQFIQKLDAYIEENK